MRLLTRRRKTRLQISGDIHAGREQIHRDRDIGVALVLVAPDQLQGFVRSARDLDDGVVVDAAVLVVEGLLQQIDDQIRMRVVDAEDERLLPRRGVEFLGEKLTNDAIEGFSDDFAVEVFDLDLYLVRRGKEIDLVASRVVCRDLLAHFPDDAFR